MELDAITLPDGSTRKLGNRIPDGGLKYKWRVWGSKDDEEVIPRDKWDELLAQYSPGLDDPHLPYIHDQDGIGQCNADATVAAVEATRMVQGLPFEKLSAADLYGRINGGSDNGSLLEDALQEMTTKGVGTAATSGLLWNRHTKYATDSERARFRVLEWVLCPTFDHCFSAVLKGRKLISGILWYDNYEPDSDGWLPLRPRGRSGGHAVFGYKPVKRNGVYGIVHLNSWSAKWGHNGRCVFPEGCYEGPVGGWWALRSVVDEGGVIPVP